MKCLQAFLLITAITFFAGCNKETPTESPVDQNPTKILLFKVNEAKFEGSTGYVVAHIGDTVKWEIMATDRDKVSSFAFSSSNSIGSVLVGFAHPLADTMDYGWGFIVDSSSNAGLGPYRSGTIVKNYITVHDSLDFQTRLEIQCIVSE